jgi:AraC family transcriptional regulator of adaptative response/methylated-DNA-[protein]-cysteine methyltransferase
MEINYESPVNVVRMTPDEYEGDGIYLNINYGFEETLFGKMLIASTSKGICYLSFGEDEDVMLSELKVIFPQATYRRASDRFQEAILRKSEGPVNLHVKGTDFQWKVWNVLLTIPLGQKEVYGDIAGKLNMPKSSRTVGTAVGNNPVSFLIPCHRVIRATGELGGYHWGVERKRKMLEWEASLTKVD